MKEIRKIGLAQLTPAVGRSFLITSSQENNSEAALSTEVF
jgi:hypothetical protein